MKLSVVYQPALPAGTSPHRVRDEQGRELDWANVFLDGQRLRQLSPRSLRIYAHDLLDFARAKPWSDTRSCQMALPSRPRARPCSTSSRYSSQTLADGGEAPCFCEKGAIKSGVTCMAGFAPESGVTCVAGFAGVRRPHPGRHTATPAAFR
jgi:hypothetical protein